MFSDIVLIVGGGIAGINLAFELESRSIEFCMVDEFRENSATRVAVGLFNPIVLKRNTLVWSASSAWQHLSNYFEIEKQLDVSFVNEEPFFKKLHDQEELNNWQLLSSDDRLKEMISLSHADHCGTLTSDFGFGVLNGVGTLNTALFISSFHLYLSALNRFTDKHFQMSDLKDSSDGFYYLDQRYSHVVFANGIDVFQESPFQTLPIKPNKGEWIRVKSEELELDGILNSSVFVKPEGNSEFTVGATYDRHKLSPLVTEERRIELMEKFEEITGSQPTSLVDHRGGIRPTSPDRKPIVGEHPVRKGMYILNGLGSRGILHAPLMAKWLCDFILDGTPIDPKVDVNRFRKRLLNH